MSNTTIAGACTTVLKAIFNESFEIPGPVVSTSDGTRLQPYSGSLTVGDELNKLALGRDTGGVHLRSDAIQGILMGEEVPILILQDLKRTYMEVFEGFSLTKFNGETVVI